MSKVIAEVIDQHVEEAAILWCRRDYATSQPHFNLEDLARLDGQVNAQIDGMRVAESEVPGAAWSVCQRELRWHAPGEVFAAAILTAEGNYPQRIADVTVAAHHCCDCSRALVAALGWLPAEPANFWIDRLLAAASPVERRIGIAASAVRGRNLVEPLANALISPNGPLRSRALKAVGELARLDLLPAAREALTASDPHGQFSAAWAVTRLEHDERALHVLQKTVESHASQRSAVPTQTSDQCRALHLVLRRMQSGAAARWINELAARPAVIRPAVVGAGVVGLPESIPWLLHMMQFPPLARVAGEAFTMITGLDLAAEKFAAPWPAGFHAGPTEDPADNNVALDEDENLPWPDAQKLADWWQKNSSKFQPGTRYLCGQPLTEDWLEHVLRHGYQRQRAAAALELALLRPDQPLFNVRAPGHRQQELLGLR